MLSHVFYIEHNWELSILGQSNCILTSGHHRHHSRRFLVVKPGNMNVYLLYSSDSDGVLPLTYIGRLSSAIITPKLTADGTISDWGIGFLVWKDQQQCLRILSWFGVCFAPPSTDVDDVVKYCVILVIVIAFRCCWPFSWYSTSPPQHAFKSSSLLLPSDFGNGITLLQPNFDVGIPCLPSNHHLDLIGIAVCGIWESGKIPRPLWESVRCLRLFQICGMIVEFGRFGETDRHRLDK